MFPAAQLANIILLVFPSEKPLLDGKVTFFVTRDSHQGSLLSAGLLNLFIEGLLCPLGDAEDQVCIGSIKMSFLVYADDITTVCCSDSAPQSQVIKGSQTFVSHSNNWEFRFGIQKAKCMNPGARGFQNDLE